MFITIQRTTPTSHVLYKVKFGTKTTGRLQWRLRFVGVQAASSVLPWWPHIDFLALPSCLQCKHAHLLPAAPTLCHYSNLKTNKKLFRFSTEQLPEGACCLCFIILALPLCVLERLKRPVCWGTEPSGSGWISSALRRRQEDEWAFWF